MRSYFSERDIAIHYKYTQDRKEIILATRVWTLYESVGSVRHKSYSKSIKIQIYALKRDNIDTLILYLTAHKNTAYLSSTRIKLKKLSIIKKGVNNRQIIKY